MPAQTRAPRGRRRGRRALDRARRANATRLRRRDPTKATRNDDAGTIAQIASRMCELGLLASADGSRALDERVVRDEDGAGSIPFRLADHAAAPSRRFQTPSRSPALSARRRFRGPPRDARAVAADLRERILRLHDEFLSDDGAFVDYEGMRSSDAFREYRHARRRRCRRFRSTR